MKNIFFVVLSVSFILRAQSNYNVTLYGNIDNYFAGGAYDYSEVWGWTDSVKNREYAFIGTSQGTSIVDITDTVIKEVSSVPGPPSGGTHYHEFRTYKNYLYVGAEGTVDSLNPGIQIVDLSTLPDSATLKKVYVWLDTNKVNNTVTKYYRAHTVSIEKHFLYVNGGDFGGTKILDISDPLNPLQVGSYGMGNSPYVHDSYIRNDTLYAAAISSGRVDIVDFTVKGHYTQNTTAKIVSKTSTVPEGATHQLWLSEDGNYMFVATETGGGHLHIYDIKDRTAPIEIATWKSSPTESIHNVFVKGDFLYIAYYGDGFRILDIKDPYTPIEVGFYDTYPNPEPGGYPGAWGVYPYFPSGKIAVSDRNTGLYIFTFNQKYGGRVTGFVKNGITNQVMENVQVAVQEMGRTYYSDISGKYTYGTAEGTHTIKFSKEGFDEKIESITTHPGMLDTVNILLTPAVTDINPSSGDSKPFNFSLSQNFPNPFNPETIISFNLPETGFTSLGVYDVLGKKVATLANEVFSAGTHSIQFDGSQLPSGIYYYTLNSGSFSNTKKMVLLR